MSVKMFLICTQHQTSKNKHLTFAPCVSCTSCCRVDSFKNHQSAFSKWQLIICMCCLAVRSRDANWTMWFVNAVDHVTSPARIL